MGGRGARTKYQTYIDSSEDTEKADRDMGYNTKGEADRWKTLLTELEKDEIQRYTNNGYLTVNKYLAGKLNYGGDEQTQKKIQTRIDAIEKGIDKFELKKILFSKEVMTEC